MKAPKREMTVYSDDLKAEAMALAELHGYRQAETMMRTRHPDAADHLSHQLIHHWHQTMAPERFANLRQERQSALESRFIEVGLKTADVFDAELDKDTFMLARDGTTLVPMSKAITAGIAADKALKILDIQARRSRPAPSFNFANFIQTNVDSP